MKRGAKGKQARRLQQEVNRHLRHRKFAWRVVNVDGHAGAATFQAAHLVLWLMGASNDQLRRVRRGQLTDHAFRLIVGQRRRSEAMIRRDKQRRPKARELRAAHRASQSPGPGLAVFADSIQRNSPAGPITVPSWMVGKRVGPDGKRRNWLGLARRNGWTGYLTSGHRDPAYSEQLCYAMCGAPSCPGRCAGRASNHAQTGPPNWGAIDATDYTNLGQIFARIGAPLKNALGPADPVHFSFTGK